MINKLGIRPFGLRDKLCYASGDLANDCTFILSSTFLMKFYTDVMGVDAYIIGIMMMVARIVDAFTDMTMGRVLDLSKPGKNGKFRPWILPAGGLVAVMSFLLYPVWFKDMSMTFKLVWMFASYLLWGSVFYTMVNIPYSSMASAITDKPEERTQLSVFRNAGATIANMIITAGIPLVVYYTNDAGKKVFNGGLFSYVAAGFSVAAIVFYLVCYFGSTERVKIEPPKKDPNGPKNNVVKNLVTNRSLLAIIVAAICLLLAQDAGTKAHCIAELLKKGYDPHHVLMVGDAPGDQAAAEKNGVWFYPILVRHEAESWAQLRQTGLDKLTAGEYEDYGKEKAAEFRRNLGA